MLWCTGHTHWLVEDQVYQSLSCPIQSFSTSHSTAALFCQPLFYLTPSVLLRQSLSLCGVVPGVAGMTPHSQDHCHHLGLACYPCLCHTVINQVSNTAQMSVYFCLGLLLINSYTTEPLFSKFIFLQFYLLRDNFIPCRIYLSLVPLTKCRNNIYHSICVPWIHEFSRYHPSCRGGWYLKCSQCTFHPIL